MPIDVTKRDAILAEIERIKTDLRTGRERSVRNAQTRIRALVRKLESIDNMGVNPNSDAANESESYGRPALRPLPKVPGQPED